jgi:hypothetical protein
MLLKLPEPPETQIPAQAGPAVAPSADAEKHTQTSRTVR